MSEFDEEPDQLPVYVLAERVESQCSAVCLDGPEQLAALLFELTKSADEILASIARFAQRTTDVQNA